MSLQYLMQAISSGDGGNGQLYTWTAAIPDFSGTAWASPGVPAEIAVLGTKNTGGGGGGGGIAGPSTSTDSALALWQGTHGDTLKNSVLTVPADGNPAAGTHVTKKDYVDTRVRTSRVKKVYTHADSPVTLDGSDEQVTYDSSGGTIVFNVEAASALRVYLFFDAGNSAGTNNVTVQAPAGHQINGGGTSALLKTNRGMHVLYADTTAGNKYWLGGPQ